MRRIGFTSICDARFTVLGDVTWLDGRLGVPLIFGGLASQLAVIWCVRSRERRDTKRKLQKLFQQVSDLYNM